MSGKTKEGKEVYLVLINKPQPFFDFFSLEGRRANPFNRGAFFEEFCAVKLKIHFKYLFEQ